MAAFPYESIYTNKKHEIGGRTEQETLALYALHGWEPSKDMFRTMNDHIGLELEFMAVLCEEELLACQTMRIVWQCQTVIRMNSCAHT